MNVGWAAVLPCIFWSISPSLQSIAGVTYMDDFDFEERYDDVNHCNPFYWHPLHLPEDCADMFQKLILSNLGRGTTRRIVKEKRKFRKERKHADEYELFYPDYEKLLKNFGIDTVQSPFPSSPFASSPLADVFESFKTDIGHNPSVPQITTIPYLGAIALYKQPVSHQTAMLIKEMSKMYGKSGMVYQPYPMPKEEKNKEEKNKTDKPVIPK